MKASQVDKKLHSIANKAMLKGYRVSFKTREVGITDFPYIVNGTHVVITTKKGTIKYLNKDLVKCNETLMTWWLSGGVKLARTARHATNKKGPGVVDAVWLATALAARRHRLLRQLPARKWTEQAQYQNNWLTQGG